VTYNKKAGLFLLACKGFLLHALQEIVIIVICMLLKHHA
jgi:hypothetical protein